MSHLTNMLWDSGSFLEEFGRKRTIFSLFSRQCCNRGNTFNKRSWPSWSAVAFLSNAAKAEIICPSKRESNPNVSRAAKSMGNNWKWNNLQFLSLSTI